MKLFIPIIYLSFFCSTFLFSQSDFRSGYIIKNNYDTVWGFIDYRDDMLNSKICVFKVTHSSEKITYSPGEINSYRFIDSKFYTSKKVPPQNFSDSVYFLECLIKGKVTVYFLRVDDEDYYFLENEEGTLSVANNSMISVTTDHGVEYLKKSNQYIGLFNVYFQDCPEVLSDVQNLSYGRKPIIDIAKTYHDKMCSPDDPCIIFERKIARNIFRYGITALSGYQKYDYYHQHTSFNGALKSYWGVGGIVSLQLSDWNERIYVEGKLTYNSMKVEGANHFEYYSKVYSFDASGLRAQINLTYIFPEYIVNPLVFTGISVGSFNYKNYRGSAISSLTTQEVEIDELLSPDSPRVGIIAGCGFLLKDHFRFTISYNAEEFRSEDRLFINGLEYSVSYFF